ncbi:MAG: hypothetical protein AAFU41_05785 [Pseudomonadota bacterium]
MTISKELFLAILSMDAYNRGPEAGIADAGDNDPDGLGDSTSGNVRVGTATVSHNLGSVSEAFQEDALATGFYAIAYDVAGGTVEGIDTDTTVISYRGTNTSLDYTRGWSVGGGWIEEGADKPPRPNSCIRPHTLNVSGFTCVNSPVSSSALIAGPGTGSST